MGARGAGDRGEKEALERLSIVLKYPSSTLSTLNDECSDGECLPSPTVVYLQISPNI